MKRIKTWDEIISLPNSTKLYQIYQGNVETFIVVGQIKQSKGLIIVNADSFKDIRFIYESDFIRQFEDIVYSTEHDSVAIGHIMINQIRSNSEKEIEAITEIYINRDSKVCKECNIAYNQKEIERIFGIESSPAKLGFCSSKCYTLNLMRNDPPE